ncbi:MAG: hypothetical protein J0H83_06965 [Candidatus Melainabacteria bacterium]|jgi:hypothetical protein|nr:hypothetical protein [Candidatus Melainabacteria bacterium]MBX9673706.1 hypothetical protein [Candidatus Obscuribacterales bacterium]
MSNLEQDLVYGVFGNENAAVDCVVRLNKAGFVEQDINVVTVKSALERVNARITNPTKKYFVSFGTCGAVGGILAGAYLTPTLPYVVSFQILTTLMAAISGGIVLGYFGMFMAAFLHANEPQYFGNAYEGTLEEGQVLVSIELNGKNKARLAEAMQIMVQGASEMIFRPASAGPIIGLEATPAIVVTPDKPVLSAVA